MNFVKLTEFADALEMTEEIDDKEFIGGKSGERGRPNNRCVFSTYRLAAFGSEQFETDRFDIRAEVERFDIQREGRQLQGTGIEGRFTWGAHTSDSVCGNFS
jgi:hypothetical protein